jgi:hypothetical protein
VRQLDRAIGGGAKSHYKALLEEDGALGDVAFWHEADRLGWLHS